MIVDLKEFIALYEQLKDDKRNTSEKNILIFVSAENCDALCAARILAVSLTAS